MSRQEAYNLIVQESGKHFDPAAIQLFMSCADQI